MAAKEKRFIVVSVGDTLGFGYNEHEIPQLLKLGEAYSPDHLVMNRTGFLAHFRTTKANVRKAFSLVANAEKLRDTDKRFTELKIGVAEGKLVGEFDFLGNIKKDGIGLLGDAIVRAVLQEQSPLAYKPQLSSLAETLHVRIP